MDLSGISESLQVSKENLCFHTTLTEITLPHNLMLEALGPLVQGWLMQKRVMGLSGLIDRTCSTTGNENSSCELLERDLP